MPTGAPPSRASDDLCLGRAAAGLGRLASRVGLDARRAGASSSPSSLRAPVGGRECARRAAPRSVRRSPTARAVADATALGDRGEPAEQLGVERHVAEMRNLGVRSLGLGRTHGGLLGFARGALRPRRKLVGLVGEHAAAGVELEKHRLAGLAREPQLPAGRVVALAVERHGRRPTGLRPRRPASTSHTPSSSREAPRPGPRTSAARARAPGTGGAPPARLTPPMTTERLPSPTCGRAREARAHDRSRSRGAPRPAMRAQRRRPSRSRARPRAPRARAVPLRPRGHAPRVRRPRARRAIARALRAARGPSARARRGRPARSRRARRERVRSSFARCSSSAGLGAPLRACARAASCSSRRRRASSAAVSCRAVSRSRAAPSATSARLAAPCPPVSLANPAVDRLALGAYLVETSLGLVGGGALGGGEQRVGVTRALGGVTAPARCVTRGRGSGVRGLFERAHGLVGARFARRARPRRGRPAGAPRGRTPTRRGRSAARPRPGGDRGRRAPASRRAGRVGQLDLGALALAEDRPEPLLRAPSRERRAPYDARLPLRGGHRAPQGRAARSALAGRRSRRELLRALRRRRLERERPEALAHLLLDVARALDLRRDARELQLGAMPAALELPEPGCLLDERSAVLGPRGEHRVDLSLARRSSASSRRGRRPRAARRGRCGEPACG